MNFTRSEADEQEFLERQGVNWQTLICPRCGLTSEREIIEGRPEPCHGRSPTGGRCDEEEEWSRA